MKKKKTTKKSFNKKNEVGKIKISSLNTGKLNNFINKNKIKLIIAFIFLILIGYQSYKSDTFLNLFGLSHNDTVYDFFQSSNEQQVHFLINSCNDGKCLTNSHWYCGYNVRNASSLDWNWNSSYPRCLENEIKNSKSHTKLEDIVLYCGIRNSYVEGFSQRLINDTKKYKKRLKECSDKGL